MFEFIRRAEPKDFDELYEIEKICFACRYRWTKPLFKEAFEHNIIWVAGPLHGKEQIQGFIAVEEHKKFGYIASVDVLPEFRNKHIGTQLICIAENFFRIKGIDKMRLHVFNKNPAHLMYAKRGYVVIDMVKNYYANGEHALLMERQL